MKLPVGIPRPEIVAPTSKNGIPCRNDLLHIFPAVPRLGQLTQVFPDSLRRLGRRPPPHKVRARVPLDAPFLANRAAQKYKALLAASQVHHARLLRMQFQTKPVHRQPDSPQCFPGLRFRPAHSPRNHPHTGPAPRATYSAWNRRVLLDLAHTHSLRWSCCTFSLGFWPFPACPRTYPLPGSIKAVPLPSSALSCTPSSVSGLSGRTMHYSI